MSPEEHAYVHAVHDRLEARVAALEDALRVASESMEALLDTAARSQAGSPAEQTTWTARWGACRAALSAIKALGLAPDNGGGG